MPVWALAGYLAGAFEILLPLVLALLLSYLLRPVVRAFARVHIRPMFSGAIILIGLISVIGYAVSFLAAPAAGWLRHEPEKRAPRRLACRRAAVRDRWPDPPGACPEG